VVDVFSALVRTLEVCEMEWVLKTLDLMFLVCEDYDLRGTAKSVIMYFISAPTCTYMHL
jgi:hypothetical protein